MRLRLLVCLVLLVLVGPAAVSAAVPAPEERPREFRRVMFVGNNWAGTASVVDVRTLEVLKRGIDLIPDKEQELADIYASPDRLALYLAIQQGPGEGHDQYVDDMFTTRNGRFLAVSRPSFGDVVWVDVAKAAVGDPDPIVRERSLDGYRADHMGVSPDRKRLLVSDSTERQVIELAMQRHEVDGRVVRMGQRLRTFESGETPHENNYSRDGKRIFHASIGKVYTPGDGTGGDVVPIGPVLDALKGDRWFEVVRDRDFRVMRRWDMGRELEEAGHPGMSSAVRPMAISPSERFVYFQVSYFHGFVKFDLRAEDLNGTVDYATGDRPEPRTGAVVRLYRLPNRVPDLPRELYVNDSAHHGLAIDRGGDTLCVAGTMDDYGALVDRRTGKRRILDPSTTGHTYLKPYWAVEGPRDTCWMSLSGSDAVAVIDFETGEELAYLPVGDHPQRVRLGRLPEATVANW